MKKLIYILTITAATAVASFGQTSAPEKANPAAAPPSPPPAAAKIVREKFDPKRNAAEDLRAAMTKAQAENKRIILDVGGEWCGWCRFMDEFFIENADLTKMRDDNFVWLKINMSEENENTEFLSKYPEPVGYPHLFVLEKDGKLLHSQGTAVLEEGKSYSKQRMTEFFAKWSPPKNAPDAQK